VWRELLPRTPDGWVGAVLAGFALLTLAQHLGLGVLACLEARHERHRRRLADRLSLFESDLAPPISILVPAHDAEQTIVESVRALTQVRYPAVEVIVVNDGSHDGTLEELRRAYGLRPSARTARARVPRGRILGIYSSPDRPDLVVVDAAGGGRAQALNIALAFARHPLVCAIEAGVVLERDTLLELALPFYRDAAVAATGGVVRPAHGGAATPGTLPEARLARRRFARFQDLESLRATLIGRLGWTGLDCLYIVPSALGLFARDAVMSVGGYRTTTLGEDMDLAMRIQRWARRHGRRSAVRFVPGAVAWAEAPERPAALAREAARRHQGLAESLWLNRGLALKPALSLRHAAALLSQLSIDLLGPVWELLGLVYLTVQLAAGRLDGVFAIIYFGGFVLAGTLNTLLGIALESVVCPRYQHFRDSLQLVADALLENFGYRQLNAWWRARGLWSALRRWPDWGAAARLGHDDAAETEPAPATLSRAKAA